MVNWWFISSNENTLTKKNENDNEITPYMVDSSLNFKVKRNYNSIRNEIVENIYNMK